MNFSPPQPLNDASLAVATAGVVSAPAGLLFEFDRHAIPYFVPVGMVGGVELGTVNHFIRSQTKAGKSFNFLSETLQPVFAKIYYVRQFSSLLFPDLKSIREGIQEVGKVSQERGKVVQGRVGNE